MNIQDPRVHMVTKDDSTQMYRAYTRSGDVIDYVVWPSLLLFEDGPLLYKGVAQLKKTSQPIIKKETSKSKIPTNQELPEITSEQDSQKSNGSHDDGKKREDTVPEHKSNGSQEDSKKREDTVPKHKSNGSQEDSKKERDTAQKQKHISVINVKNVPSNTKMDQV